MRIDSISIRNFPPIKTFDVQGLGDFVVVAGRNGAGKTRLIQQIVQKFRNLRTPNVEIGVQLTSPDEFQHFPQIE